MIGVIAGRLVAFLSGRILYAMQLGGPSITVDTTCSSLIKHVGLDYSTAIAGGDTNSPTNGPPHPNTSNPPTTPSTPSRANNNNSPSTPSPLKRTPISGSGC